MLSLLLPLRAIFLAYISALIILVYRNSTKKAKFPYVEIYVSTISAPEIASHITVLIVISKLLLSNVTSDGDLLLGILLCFSASFLVGIVVGKAQSLATEPKERRVSTVTPVIGTLETILSPIRRVSIKDRSSESSVVAPSPYDNGRETFVNIDPNSDFLPNGMDMENIIRKGISALVSIVGLTDSPDYTYEYVNNNWKVIRSDKNMELSASQTKTDGILFHGSTRIGAPPSTIFKWILNEDDLTTGIECISSKRDNLQSWKNGEIILRRYIVKSGSIRSSNRMFTILTNVTKSSDGTIIISSRSVDIPLDLSDIDPKAHSHGCIRALMFTSGYIIKPIQENGKVTASSLLFATHIDMLGSTNRRMNALKYDTVINSLINTFEKYNSRSPCNVSASLFDAAKSPKIPGASKLLDANVPVIKTEADLKEHARIRARSTLQQIRALHRDQILSGKLNMRITEGAYRALSGGDAHMNQDDRKGWKITKHIAGVVKDRSYRRLPSDGTSRIPDNIASEMELLLQRDGISICEHLDPEKSGQSFGVFSAYCHVEAPVAVVRAAIMDGRSIVEGMSVAKNTVIEIEPKTRVQWQAFKSPYPFGSRDFLFASTEESFSAGKGTRGQGFVQAWTSVDDLCEDSIEIQERIARIIRRNNIVNTDFTRTALRLGGYICVPTASGGCDVSLFIDADLYSEIPVWMTTILAQFVLFEAMRELQFCAASSFTANGTVTSSPRLRFNQIDRILNQSAKHEAKGDEISVVSAASEIDSKTTGSDSKFSSRRKQVQPLSAATIAALERESTVGKSEGVIEAITASSDRDDTPSKSGPPQVETQPRDPDETTEGAMTHSRTLYDSIYSQVSPAKDGKLGGGSDPARDAVRVFMRYVDIGRMTEAKRAMGLNWLSRVSKNNIEIETSPVNGSEWQALRGTCYVNANKQFILNLLTDEKRNGEYDDMYDFQELIQRIDDKTLIRRVAFKGIWPTSPRDFVCVSTWTEFRNGSLLVCSSSHKDAMAEKSGYVRGDLYTSGFLIQPTEILTKDPQAKQLAPNGCKVTLCAHTSLGGSIPSSIINMLSTSAPLKVLQNITDIATKDQAKANKK